MYKTVQLEISKVVQKELEKIPRWKIMLLLQQKGELSAYEISKELGWTTGKVHSIIRKLEESGAIATRVEIVNNRVVKFVKLKN